MAIIDILPFDENLGFPQRAAVNLKGAAHDLFYRWNHVGEFAVLKIVNAQSETVFNVPLTLKNPFEIKDRTTLEVLFTIFPWTVTIENAEVWVFT